MREPTDSLADNVKGKTTAFKQQPWYSAGLSGALPALPLQPRTLMSLATAKPQPSQSQLGSRQPAKNFPHAPSPAKTVGRGSATPAPATRRPSALSLTVSSIVPRTPGRAQPLGDARTPRRTSAAAAAATGSPPKMQLSRSSVARTTAAAMAIMPAAMAIMPAATAVGSPYRQRKQQQEEDQQQKQKQLQQQEEQQEQEQQEQEQEQQQQQQQRAADSFADVIMTRQHLSHLPWTVGKVLLQLPRVQYSRAHRRLVFKNGDCNVSNKRIQKVHRHFLADIYTSIVDLKWRYILLMCAITFASSWLFFGALWFLIGYAHGDFYEDPSKRPAQPCVAEVHGFASAFLYSIETQHTVGYGVRHPTEACSGAILLLMVQSLFGMILQALTTGAMFAKLARPKKRAETLMFSRNAVICKRDGHMCLMFRIGDMRRSHLVGASVRALLIRRRVSAEGEVLPLDSSSVPLGLGEDRLMIVWPVIVLHRIDEKSPFWQMSRGDLEHENFELIVILEGVIEATGMTTQAMTSYLPEEILWGHRLKRLITFQKENGKYEVDYSHFHSTTPVDTPTCSAKEQHERAAHEPGNCCHLPGNCCHDDDYACSDSSGSSAGSLHRESPAGSWGAGSLVTFIHEHEDAAHVNEGSTGKP